MKELEKDQTANEEEIKAIRTQLAGLGPYQKKSQDKYSYKLRGTVVHSGGASFGHYFSYINTNRDDPSSLSEEEKA